MDLQAEQPIGIFDSGIGGLTVAHQLHQKLPNESFIYFGDVAHHPYGEKSLAAIQAYAVKICEFLLKKNCKLIVIACHTAASAASELVKAYVAQQALVVDVIDPTIAYLHDHFANQSVGVIGTRQTIHSQIYQQKTAALQANIVLHALATPMLAPMIEEGYMDNPALIHTLFEHLSHPSLATIDALLLGCTHYPLIKTQITQYYYGKRDVVLIDSAAITAQAINQLLIDHDLCQAIAAKAFQQFYVSDYTESFIASARYFFPYAIHFEKYPLWG